MKAIDTNIQMPTGTRRKVVLWAALLAVCAAMSATLAARVLAQNAPTAAPASAAPAPSAPVLASTMAHSCAACHGTNGQLGDESFAPLAGMPVGQFVKTMTDFREGRRPTTLMGHVAKGFSDEDFKGMGEFFAAQTAGGQP
jgi:sulfide dehydrogenase cytochrome subunit